MRYSHRFPSTRAIKELLIKGADRDAVEKNGLKPIDLVDRIDDLETKEELVGLLKKPTFILPCCHLRQPMIKVEKSASQVVLFLFLMCGTFLANMIFVYPCKSSDPLLSSSPQSCSFV